MLISKILYSSEIEPRPEQAESSCDVNDILANDLGNENDHIKHDPSKISHLSRILALDWIYVMVFMPMRLFYDIYMCML